MVTMSPLPPPPPPSPHVGAAGEKRVEFRRANRKDPIARCCAITCLALSILLIGGGTGALIIFLTVRPRTPSFDAAGARLAAIYFDSPEHFNGDLTLLANFSNPNTKMTVRIHGGVIELYFAGVLISTRAVQPFTENPGETRVEPVHLISSLVFMPRNHAEALRKQVQNYVVRYSIGARFRVTATWGPINFSYWLHKKCQLDMTGPPAGTLIHSHCRE